jgi:GxxExxY protein
MTDEEPVSRWPEPDPELNVLTEQAIGAAIEVHRELGAGLDEALYEAAMCIELRRRQVPFDRQVVQMVHYKGEPIGEKRLDLIIAGRVVIELKAVEVLTPLHKAQLRTYLKITGLRLGLLINFNVPVLTDGLKRVLNPSVL